MNNNVAFLATDVGRLFRKRFDVAARQLGVTGPQWRMLTAIRRTPGTNQCALASWLEVEAITAGRMIDRLEKVGFVERRHDPADRRKWRLFLTPESERLMERLAECATDVFADALVGFDDTEHQQVLALLQRLRANLSDEPITEAKLAHG
ncbi:MarR family winged helix-turn-helix transcriptional regulator [Novosphingobium sp.]|uniref:MarR family winged helix-turn-helix transcriptional regulator n=1 Tax=Novosphingobium sp. TaxID=1874826 RepID=UPI0038B96EC2